MDLDGLFWIALIVFYFLSRALGGKRKPAKRRPQPQTGPQPERSGERGGNDELDVALEEIRRALGFPGPEPDLAETGAGESQSADQPDRNVRREQQVAREQDHLIQQRQARERKAAREKEELVRRQQQARNRQTARENEDALRRERRTRERQAAREQEAAQRRRAELKRHPARERKRPPHPQTAKGTPFGREMERPSGQGERPISSYFADDVSARRTGVSDRQEEQEKLQVLRPYDTATPKQHSGIRRRLSHRASLRASFLVKEILDRPLALRRRRR